MVLASGAAMRGLRLGMLVACTMVASRCCSAQQYAISTIAGSGVPSFGGDGGSATSADIRTPKGVATGNDGSVYVADQYNNRIRKVKAGTITTFAGSGSSGEAEAAFAGDGGAATAAKLNTPWGVAVTDSGTVYIADTLNYRVRKVLPNGTITTFAGDGVARSQGDGGLAASASLNQPNALAVGADGSTYICEYAGHRIRKVLVNGTITTFAGDGVAAYGGDGGRATAASLQYPTGLAIAGDGSVFIADAENNRIRKVLSDGTIVTVAGNGAPAYTGDGVQATAASLFSPQGVAIASDGSVFISDTGNQRIRRLLADGTIVTVAGNGTAAYNGEGAPATSYTLSYPFGLAVDVNGVLYLSDRANNRVRMIVPPTPSPSTTATSTRTASSTNSATWSASPSSTATVSAASSPSATPSASATLSPTGTSAATPTTSATWSASPSSSATVSAASSPSATHSASTTLSPTDTGALTATFTSSAGTTSSSSASLTATSTGSASATRTATLTAVATYTTGMGVSVAFVLTGIDAATQQFLNHQGTLVTSLAAELSVPSTTVSVSSIGPSSATGSARLLQSATRVVVFVAAHSASHRSELYAAVSVAGFVTAVQQRLRDSADAAYDTIQVDLQSVSTVAPVFSALPTASAIATATASAIGSAVAPKSPSACADGDWWCALKTTIIAVVSAAGGALAFIGGIVWRRYVHHNNARSFARTHPLAAHVFTRLGYDINDHDAASVKAVVKSVAAVERELQLVLPKLHLVAQKDTDTAHAAVPVLARCLCEAIVQVSEEERVAVVVTTPWACTCGLVRTTDLTAPRLAQLAQRIACAAAVILQARDHPLFDMVGGEAMLNNPMQGSPVTRAAKQPQP
jgi:hypothetical protein